MRYSTLLIDLDHTLLDSDASERLAFEATLGGAGIDDPLQHLDTYATINGALWAAVERGEIGAEDVRVARFARLADRLALDIDPVALADTFVTGLAEYGELYTDARAVLDALAGRARLALVTNGLSDVQRRRIERLDLAGYFETVSISTEIGSAKPDRAIYDATFAALGEPPRDAALMLGDSLTSDIRGGEAYGIATCWYNPSGRGAAGDRDRKGRPDFEITRLAEFPSVAIEGTSAAPRRR